MMNKLERFIMRKILIILMAIIVLLAFVSCDDSSLATVYEHKGDNWKKIMTVKTEDDWSFLVTLTSGGTPWGSVTDVDDANYKIVFSEGDKTEATYHLIVDYENESIAYIAPDLFGVGSMDVFIWLPILNRASLYKK